MGSITQRGRGEPLDTVLLISCVISGNDCVGRSAEVHTLFSFSYLWGRISHKGTLRTFKYTLEGSGPASSPLPSHCSAFAFEPPPHTEMLLTSEVFGDNRPATWQHPVCHSSRFVLAPSSDSALWDFNSRAVINSLMAFSLKAQGKREIEYMCAGLG